MNPAVAHFPNCGMVADQSYSRRDKPDGESQKSRKQLTSPHTPLAVNDPWKGRSGLESAVADLVIETDAVVGRVLDALEQSGAADHTLVLFTSDNTR